MYHPESFPFVSTNEAQSMQRNNAYVFALIKT